MIRPADHAELARHGASGQYNTGSAGTQVRAPLRPGLQIRLTRAIAGISFGITMIENEIKGSLVALLGAINAGDGQAVASEMARTEGLLERNREALHPQLVHFLQNRSYAKAVMFLGGETDIPVGVCGGRAGKD